LTSATRGTLTSSMGTCTDVEGNARIISDAAGIVAMWISNETKIQEYKIRSFMRMNWRIFRLRS
jgi:hypothetical protein